MKSLCGVCVYGGGGLYHLQAHSCHQSCYEEFALLGEPVLLGKGYLNLGVQMQSLLPQMYMETVIRKNLSTCICLSIYPSMLVSIYPSVFLYEWVQNSMVHGAPVEVRR